MSDTKRDRRHSAAKPKTQGIQAASPEFDVKGPAVYQQLYGLVIDGTFPPGTRLKEIELAQRFGFSRTPVREALRRLEMQGLAVHQPHKGMVVATLEPQAVNELYAMREALEGTAAALAARHASDIEIGILGELITHDRQRTDDADHMARSNRAFHAAIHACAGNRYLTSAINTLHEAMALLGPTTLATPARALQSLDEHQAIVDSIRARNSAEAERAARAHVRAAFGERLRLNVKLLTERPLPSPDDI